MGRERARLRDERGGQRPRRRYDAAPQRRGRPAPRAQAYRRRRVWPWLLSGCAIGVGALVLAAAIVVVLALRSANGVSSISGILPPAIVRSSAYTQQSAPQPVSVGPLSAIQVHDNIGDVTISVDANAATPSVAYTKKVQAASSADANRQFDGISVQVQPAHTPAGTLSVNATVPSPGGLFGNHNASVDLAIVLPAQSSANATQAAAPLALALNMSIGNATLSNLNGTLNVKNDFGNITVKRSTLFDGSRLQTGPGNIDFSGALSMTPAANNTQARYWLTSETGNITAALPADTNLTLDASTNSGAISSVFPITVQSSSGGGASYYGPLNPSSSSQSASHAVLTLSASTGSIRLAQA